MDSFESLRKLMKTQEAIATAIAVVRPNWYQNIPNAFWEAEKFRKQFSFLANYKPNTQITEIINRNRYATYGISEAVLKQIELNKKTITASEQFLNTVLRNMGAQLLHAENARKMISYGNMFNRFYSDALLSAALADQPEQADAIDILREKTAAIIVGVEKNKGLTLRDLQNLKIEIIDFIKEQVIPKKWIGLTRSDGIAFVFLLISCLFTYIVQITATPANGNVTIDQMNDFRNETLQEIDSLVESKLNYRFLNINFRLRSFPQYSSTKLMYLKKGTKVQVLNSTGSWVFVTCMDKDKEYPVDGWIPKDALTKKK